MRVRLRRRCATSLKAWLLLARRSARLLGVARLVARRLPARAALRRSAVCCSASALYWYADRIVMGMVGARELLPGEAPALHSTVERLALARRRREAAALRDPGRLPARARRRAAAPRARRSRSARACSALPSPAELEGDRRARARARPQPRRARPDDRGRARGARSSSARRIGGWLAAGAAVRPRPARGRRSCTCCSRRSASSRPTGSRPSSASRRTASPTRSSASSRRCELVEFQASPATEPLYTINPFAEDGLATLFVTHPPVGERVRRLRELDPGLAREAARRLETTKGRLAGPSEDNPAASYSPGRLPSEYHRRWRA